MGTRQKCHKFGRECAINSVLGLWNYDKTAITALTDQQLRDRLNLWDTTPLQTNLPTNPPVYKSFELRDVLGGMGYDGSGQVVSAEILAMNLWLTKDVNMVEVEGRVRMRDPIVSMWEGDAICLLGITDNHPNEEDFAGKSCSTPSGSLSYSGFFGRSLSDEFGKAVRADAAALGIAYVLMIFYLFVNLGKRDVVHSAIALSVACVASVGLSYTSAMGLGALFQVKDNPLSLNVPFLLLGLGVDDASCWRRNSRATLWLALVALVRTCWAW